MAKRPDLTKTQRGIVNRYYQHEGSIRAGALGELVSEIYLADTEAKAKRLWTKAQKGLIAAGVKPEQVDPVIQARDIEALTKLIAKFDAKA